MVVCSKMTGFFPWWCGYINPLLFRVRPHVDLNINGRLPISYGFKLVFCITACDAESTVILYDFNLIHCAQNWLLTPVWYELICYKLDVPLYSYYECNYFTKMMYNERVILIYIYCASCGIPTRITISFSCALLVLFPLVILGWDQIFTQILWFHP